MSLHLSWPRLCEGQQRLRDATCLLAAITLQDELLSRAVLGHLARRLSNNLFDLLFDVLQSERLSQHGPHV